jgi:GNAT superfamily N-acetyltransferase
MDSVARIVVRVRRAVPDDAVVLWSIRSEAIRQGCAGQYSTDQIAAWAAVQMPDAFFAAISESVFLVAEEDGVACGFGFMTPETSTIEALFVSPARHRRGVGGTLLGELER